MLLTHILKCSVSPHTARLQVRCMRSSMCVSCRQVNLAGSSSAYYHGKVCVDRHLSALRSPSPVQAEIYWYWCLLSKCHLSHRFFWLVQTQPSLRSGTLQPWIRFSLFALKAPQVNATQSWWWRYRATAKMLDSWVSRRCVLHESLCQDSWPFLLRSEL